MSTINTELLNKIERIEVAEIHPGDTVILHLGDNVSQEVAHRILNEWERSTGHQALAFSNGMRIEIQRHVDE